MSEEINDIPNNRMHSDDDSSISTTSENTVTSKHLILLISLRLSMKNVIEAFIPNFDK
jgi:hypothetical protein